MDEWEQNEINSNINFESLAFLAFLATQILRISTFLTTQISMVQAILTTQPWIFWTTVLTTV